MNNINSKTQSHLLSLASYYKNICSDYGTTVERQLMNEYLLNSGKNLHELDIFNKSTFLKVCRWCLVSWKSGRNRVYIEPEKKKGKSMRYLCRKKYEKLNKHQKDLVEKCNKNNNHNFLVVQCLECRKKSKLPLHKPEIVKVVFNDNEEQVKDKIRKKKKKKKDLCAGLNPLVVAKLQSTNAHTRESNNKTIQSNSNKTLKESNSGISKPSLQNTSFNHLNRLKIKKLLDADNATTTPVVKKTKSLLSSFLDSL